jgi:hypothetical protein
MGETAKAQESVFEVLAAFAKAYAQERSSIIREWSVADRTPGLSKWSLLFGIPPLLGKLVTSEQRSRFLFVGGTTVVSR